MPRWKAKNFTEIVELEHRWPKTGDKLIRPSGVWRRGGEFAEDAHARQVHLESGFWGAAELLVEAARQEHLDAPFLAYPILFCYRHAIELAMKWIVSQYGPHSSVDLGDADDHNLWRLWKTCREVIEEIGGSDEAISIVERLIKELHDLDPKSAVAFRYPKTKNGGEIPLPNFWFDLDNLQDVMEGVRGFFTGADGQLNNNVSAAPSSY